MQGLEEDYRIAAEGRGLWLEIKEKYGIDDLWYIVVFPEKDVRLNQLVMAHLPHFLERKFISKAIVIMKNENEDLKNLNIEQDGIKIYFRYMESGHVEKILKYYRLMQFEKNIIVVSLAEPYGNVGIIGKEGITLEDYVKDALLV